MNNALFLDRDGVINRMVKYDYGWDSPQKPDGVWLVADIEKVISWAHQKNILVVEVSNQPGVAKGKMDQKTADAIEQKVHELLKEKGEVIDKTYICPHHPNAVVPALKKNCECRKPKPGLLFQAAKELNIDLKKSVFLGDKASDVEAAKNSSVTSLLYVHNFDEPNKNEEARRVRADFKTSSFTGIIKILRNFYIL